jgi:hypothetical protein
LWVMTNPDVVGAGVSEAGYWAVASMSAASFQAGYTTTRRWLAIGY